MDICLGWGMSLNNTNNGQFSKLETRFRGFCPIVVDVETGGLDPKTDALLEVAFVALHMDDSGTLKIAGSKNAHLEPFENARLDPKALEFNKIDPSHPFRFAVSEKEALTSLIQFADEHRKKMNCKRCVLVAHNAWFDLHFLNQGLERCKLKNKSPFHPFTCFDTATLAGFVYGQTVLAEAMRVAKIEFNAEEAHSALYDAEKTAELFCQMVNNQLHLIQS